MNHHVYILASRYKGTLYIGCTSDLLRRLEQRRCKAVEGFTKRYNVTRLVHFEMFPSVLEARAREYVLKRWRREWKIQLIEATNPEWRDLSAELMNL